MVQVTAAIIKNEQGEVLICQRGAGGSCAYLWEFPGGKLEADESLEQCIVRECKEELEIDIKIKSIFAEYTYQYPKRELAFTFYTADIIGGTLKMDVHKDMRWVRIENLNEYEFCPADVEIVERLRS